MLKLRISLFSLSLLLTTTGLWAQSLLKVEFKKISSFSLNLQATPQLSGVETIHQSLSPLASDILLKDSAGKIVAKAYRTELSQFELIIQNTEQKTIGYIAQDQSGKWILLNEAHESYAFEENSKRNAIQFFDENHSNLVLQIREHNGVWKLEAPTQVEPLVAATLVAQLLKNRYNRYVKYVAAGLGVGSVIGAGYVLTQQTPTHPLPPSTDLGKAKPEKNSPEFQLSSAKPEISSPKHSKTSSMHSPINDSQPFFKKSGPSRSSVSEGFSKPDKSSPSNAPDPQANDSSVQDPSQHSNPQSTMPQNSASNSSEPSDQLSADSKANLFTSSSSLPISPQTQIPPKKVQYSDLPDTLLQTIASFLGPFKRARTDLSDPENYVHPSPSYISQIKDVSVPVESFQTLGALSRRHATNWLTVLNQKRELRLKILPEQSPEEVLTTLLTLYHNDCSQIVELDASGTRFKDSDLKKVRKYFPNVKILNLASTWVTNKMGEELEKMTQLEELNLSGTNIFAGATRPGVEHGIEVHLAHLIHLTHLDLKNTELRYTVYPAFSKMTKLQWIELPGNAESWFADDALSSWYQSSPFSNTLTHFTMIDGGSGILDDLKFLPQLTYLRLSHTDLEYYGSQTLELLRSLPELRYLFLDRTRLSIPLNETPVDLSKLEVADLTFTRVGDNIASQLATSSHLKILILKNTRVSDQIIHKLSSHKDSLAFLDLTSNDDMLYSDAFLDQLGQFSQLTHLYIKNCPNSQKLMHRLNQQGYLESLKHWDFR